MTAIWIIGGVLLLAVVLIYNSLVAKKNQVGNIFASLDALLKKRYDLVPNLVETVKGYAGHERAVLENIANLRAQALAAPAGTAAHQQAESRLARSLGGIMAVAESYPQLKADRNFLQLQAALAEVEEQISAARRAYNASVTDYNNALEMLPTSLLASLLGYQRRPLFEIDAAQREAVPVKFE